MTGVSERPALPRSADTTARTLVRVAVFAALVCVLAMLPGLPVGPVPITLQTLGVMLAGAVLGPRLGAASMLLYLLLIAIGLPVASGFRGGLGLFAGATGGFLLSWPAAALVVGLATRRPLRRLAEGHSGRAAATVTTLLGVLLGGVVVVYAVGLPWMKLITGLPWDKALSAGMLVFLPGDLLKTVVATLVAVGVARALPQEFRSPR